MTLQTKYDYNDTVYFVNRNKKRVELGVVTGIQAIVSSIGNHNRYDLQTGEDCGATYIHEDDIFLTREEAEIAFKTI